MSRHFEKAPPSLSGYDVLLTANYSPWSRYSGGGQKSTHQVACALARRGLRVGVIYTKAPWERVEAPADLPYRVHWAWFLGVRPGISSPLRFLNGLSVVWTARRLSGPQTVLHSNGEEGSLLRQVPEKRCVVVTNRYPNYDRFLFDADWERGATWLRILFREPRFVAQALSLRQADAITVTSSHSRDQVSRCFGIPVEALRVVFNGLDDRFRERLWTGLVTCEEGATNENAVGSACSGIFYYGRLTRAKGVDLLLRAYARLPESLRTLHRLFLVGEGPDAGPLRELARELAIADRIDWLGWRSGEQIVALMMQCRLCALPSREESFGNTMLETLALGVPLLTSRAGSLAEVTGGHGIQGDVTNEDWFAKQLESELTSSPDLARWAAAAEWTRNTYSWEQTAEQFAEIYDRYKPARNSSQASE
jgi:glycosyltransferase involved in cell wall biosynthesis